MSEHATPDETSSDNAGLAAVEKAMLGFPGIERAAVVIRTTGDTDRLLAYATPTIRADLPDTRLLREHLTAELPNYAVPDRVMILESLPVLTTGEVDTTLLPEPNVPADPRSVRAGLLAELFAAVLRKATVRSSDNFFDAGGHSLLVTRLVNHIRSVLDVDVTVRDLFDAESIGSAIADLDQQQRPHAVLARRPDSPTAQSDAGDGGVIAMAIRLTGPLDIAALEAALRDVVTRHDEPHGGDPVLGRSNLAEHELAERLAAQAKLPANVSPHATLFRLEPRDHVLSLVFDAASVDVRSTEIVRRDMGTAYRARLAGRSPTWELSAIRPTDRAAWLADLLGPADDPASVSGQQLRYWQETLGNAPAAPIPVRGQRAPSGDIGVASLDVPPELEPRLRAIARENRATLLMVLQAGLAVLLHRLTGHTDVLVGTTDSGRWSAALDEVVGRFANPVVLRVDTADTPAFGELVTRVRQAALSADMRRELPFRRVAARLWPGRPSPCRASIDLRTIDQHDDWPGLTVRGLPTVAPLDVDLAFEFHTSSVLDADLRYAADRFDRSAADDIGADLIRILAGAAVDPNLSIDQLATR